MQPGLKTASAPGQRAMHASAQAVQSERADAERTFMSLTATLRLAIQFLRNGSGGGHRAAIERPQSGHRAAATCRTERTAAAGAAAAAAAGARGKS